MHKIQKIKKQNDPERTIKTYNSPGGEGLVGTFIFFNFWRMKFGKMRDNLKHKTI